MISLRRTARMFRFQRYLGPDPRNCMRIDCKKSNHTRHRNRSLFPECWLRYRSHCNLESNPRHISSCRHLIPHHKTSLYKRSLAEGRCLLLRYLYILASSSTNGLPMLCLGVVEPEPTASNHQQKGQAPRASPKATPCLTSSRIHFSCSSCFLPFEKSLSCGRPGAQSYKRKLPPPRRVVKVKLKNL